MKNINAMDLGSNDGEILVLKTCNLVQKEDGKYYKDGKYELVTHMLRIVDKNGKPGIRVHSGAAEYTGPSYYIAENTKKKTPRDGQPNAWLSILPDRDAEGNVIEGTGSLVCGLYVHTDPDSGDVSLRGRPLGEDAPLIRYFVAVDKYNTFKPAVTEEAPKTGTDG